MQANTLITISNSSLSLVLYKAYNFNYCIMEKKEIKVYYSGSGVRTLKDTGTFLFVIAVISAIMALVGLIISADDPEIGMSITTTSAYLFFVCLIGGAICKGLSSIAKTALYKRTILESEYYFIDQ